MAIRQIGITVMNKKELAEWLTQSLRKSHAETRERVAHRLTSEEAEGYRKVQGGNGAHGRRKAPRNKRWEEEDGYLYTYVIP